MTIENKKNLGDDSWLVIKILRHGQKGPDSFLSQAGKDLVFEKGKQDGLNTTGDYTTIRATGSGAESYVGGTPRAMHSAQLYASAFMSAKKNSESLLVSENPLLSYQHLVTAPPVDYAKEQMRIMESEQYKNILRDEGAQLAQRHLETEIVRAYLTHPQCTYKNEAVGRMSKFILQELRGFERELQNGSAENRTILVAGTHSPTLDLLINETLVVGKKTYSTPGDNLDGLGGAHLMGESYNVVFGVIDGRVQKNPSVLLERGRDARYSRAMLSLESGIMKERGDLYDRLHK